MPGEIGDLWPGSCDTPEKKKEHERMFQGYEVCPHCNDKLYCAGGEVFGCIRCLLIWRKR